MGTKQASGAGLRAIYLFTVDANGDPDGDQSGADGYDGTKLSGARSLTSNVPDAQTIPHIGDDRVFAMDVLPPNELETATLTTGKTNLTADAILSSTLVQQVASDIEMGLMATDKQGQEADVCVVATRQAVDVEPGSGTQGQRRYITKIYPRSRVIPKGSPFEQGGADENSYNVVPSPVDETPWGVGFTVADNGATEAQSLRLVSENPIIMERWTGNATLTEFNLNKTPITAAKTHVWSNGAAATVSSVDTGTPSLTLDSAPANAAVVVALYETTDSL